ncbi:hypothetical protein E2320_012518 [Naja naja]|nr:hypothetical protein E2320_012518 [Naja naja]
MDCREWRLQLPDSKEAPSRSESICTEDLADEFHKGLVDLLLSSDEDEAPSGLTSGSRVLRPPTSNATILPEVADLSTLLWILSDWSRQASGGQQKRPRRGGAKNWLLIPEKVPSRVFLNMESRMWKPHEKKALCLGRTVCQELQWNGCRKGRPAVERNHHARLQSTREEVGFSRNSGFLELERGGKGPERSSEPRKNITIGRSSKHQLVTGDPASSWQRARRTPSKITHAALELENFQEALQEHQELARRRELQMEEHQDKVEKTRRQGRQYGALQVEEREAEVIQLQEAMQKQATALKAQNALHQEQKKWEANAQTALRMQREVLGEQDRKRRTDLQRALEKERKLNGALRNEAGDLRQKIEGLENQARLLEEEKRASLEELQVGLQKEKDEALQRLREELEQERMQEREEMRMKLQQMEEGEEQLQAECSRMSLREQEAQAQADRMDHFWATQVAIACQQLQEVLPEKAALRPDLLCRGVLPLSSGTALQALREVKEEVQSYVQELNHELERRRQRISQLQREKEVELRQQKEHLHLQSQSVLEALKEQLVQDHMNDILALQRSWLKEGQEKDKPAWSPSPEERVGELRAAQKKVACREDEADCTPINQRKEELDLDQNGCLSSNSCKNLATFASGGRHFSMVNRRGSPVGRVGLQGVPYCQHPDGLLCERQNGWQRMGQTHYQLPEERPRPSVAPTLP